MKRYYLRLEGMNFGHFIDDTQDLSTIRGGGLLLLDAPRALGELELVAQGASGGIFAFEAENDAAAHERRRKIVERLNKHPRYLHATVAIDVAPKTDDFHQDKEILLALNRWSQMSSPSLAFPSPTAKAEPCALDRLRPARGREIDRRDERAIVSESVWQRREYGRDQKQSFYERELGETVPAKFSQDLQELTQDPAQGHLDGKMAVIYIDGNKFGRLNRKYAKTPEGQRDLDRALQGKRRDVLRALVHDALKIPALLENRAEPTIRLETLLWGGDEMVWVVPAWAAWWVIGHFYDPERDWSYKDEKLTHACGVVFCNHKAPIHRMRRLAKDLGDLAKLDRGRDLIAYEVLESFDDLGDDLTKARAQRYRHVDAGDLLLEPAKIADAIRVYAEVSAELPARQVHAAAGALIDGDADALKTAVARIDAAVTPERRKALTEAFGGTHAEGSAAWLHLGELADYLIDPRQR